MQDFFTLQKWKTLQNASYSVGMHETETIFWNKWPQISKKQALDFIQKVPCMKEAMLIWFDLWPCYILLTYLSVSGWMTPRWEAMRWMLVTRPRYACFIPNLPPITPMSTMSRTPCRSWFLSKSMTSAGSKRSCMMRRGSVCLTSSPHVPACTWFPSSHEAMCLI